MFVLPLKKDTPLPNEFKADEFAMNNKVEEKKAEENKKDNKNFDECLFFCHKMVKKGNLQEV